MHHSGVADHLITTVYTTHVLVVFINDLWLLDRLPGSRIVLSRGYGLGCVHSGEHGHRLSVLELQENHVAFVHHNLFTYKLKDHNI